MNDEQRQQAIHETVVRMDERQTAHCKRFETFADRHEERMGRVERTLFSSNGVPGIVTEVALLKSAGRSRLSRRHAIVTACLSALSGLAVFLATR